MCAPEEHVLAYFKPYIQKDYKILSLRRFPVHERTMTKIFHIVRLLCNIEIPCNTVILGVLFKVRNFFKPDVTFTDMFLCVNECLEYDF